MTRLCRECGEKLSASAKPTHGLCERCYAAVPLYRPKPGEPVHLGFLTAITVEKMTQIGVRK